MGRRDSRLATYGRAATGASVITRLPDLLGPYPLNGFCRFQKDRRQTLPYRFREELPVPWGDDDFRQKFSIIQALLAVVYSRKAKWWPSGDGMAQVS